MQKHGGFSRSGAIAAIKREHRRSTGSKTPIASAAYTKGQPKPKEGKSRVREAPQDDESDESEETSSTSDDGDEQRATNSRQRPVQRATADQVKQFNDTVAALQRQGVALEDARRSAHLRMTHGRSQGVTGASQAGSASRRPIQRRKEQEEESSEQSD